MTRGANTEEKELSREELEKLCILLLGDWMLLSKENISTLLEVRDQVRDKIHRIYVGFPYELERILRYRKRKQELDKLSTEELRLIYIRTKKEKVAIIAADVDDDLDDSFFEAPPIDSEEHIVYELLKERKAL